MNSTCLVCWRHLKGAHCSQNKNISRLCPAHHSHLTLIPTPSSPFQRRWPPFCSSSLSWPLSPQGLGTSSALRWKLFLPSSAPFNTHSSLQAQFRHHFLEGSLPHLALPPGPVSRGAVPSAITAICCGLLIYSTFSYRSQGGNRTGPSSIHRRKQRLPRGPMAAPCAPGPSHPRRPTRGAHCSVSEKLKKKNPLQVRAARRALAVHSEPSQDSGAGGGRALPRSSWRVRGRLLPTGNRGPAAGPPPVVKTPTLPSSREVTPSRQTLAVARPRRLGPVQTPT